jgi:hypothetical protein
MIYNINDFNRQNGEELIFIRAWIAAGEPDLKENAGVDVEFKMNGKDVDFKKFVKSFIEKFDFMMKMEAANILKEKYDTTGFDNLVNSIEKLQKSVQSKIKETISSTLNLSEHDVERIFDADSY